MISRSIGRSLNIAATKFNPAAAASSSFLVSKSSIRFYASPSADTSSSNSSSSEPAIKIIKGSDLLVDEKIVKLVNEISALSLYEASILVQELKTRLNIKDVVIAQPSAVVPSSNAQQNNQVAAEEVEVKKEKTEFTIILEKFDAAQKAKVIREMKNLLPGANLVEAKKFVESAPKTIMENAPKEQVEKIKQILEAVGAVVKIE